MEEEEGEEEEEKEEEGSKFCLARKSACQEKGRRRGSGRGMMQVHVELGHHANHSRSHS